MSNSLQPAQAREYVEAELIYNGESKAYGKAGNKQKGQEHKYISQNKSASAKTIMRLQTALSGLGGIMLALGFALFITGLCLIFSIIGAPLGIPAVIISIILILLGIICCASLKHHFTFWEPPE